MMFQKILKVNNRRNQSLNPINHSTYSHKNLTNLKKTISTINQKNNVLANKLVTTRSELSQDKLMENYQRHKEIKERLMKYEYDEDYGNIIPKKIKSLTKIKFNTNVNSMNSSGYGNLNSFNN